MNAVEKIVDGALAVIGYGCLAYLCFIGLVALNALLSDKDFQCGVWLFLSRPRFCQ